MTVPGRGVITKADEPHAAGPRRSVVLSELERHGYVVEPHSASSANGAICRHPEAPTLMVTEEGQLELVEGEPVNRISMPPQIAGSRIHHGRALLILTLLAVATFVGLLFVAMIVG